MQPAQFIVYFGNDEAVSPAIHEIANKSHVDLRKPVTYLRSWRVEEPQHGWSVPTH